MCPKQQSTLPSSLAAISFANSSNTAATITTVCANRLKKRHQSLPKAPTDVPHLLETPHLLVRPRTSPSKPCLSR